MDVPVSVDLSAYLTSSPFLAFPQDARRRGFGAMESGGHPQEAGWRRGFEDESRVPSAVRQETFPAGGRKRVW